VTPNLKGNFSVPEMSRSCSGRRRQRTARPRDQRPPFVRRPREDQGAAQVQRLPRTRRGEGSQGEGGRVGVPGTKSVRTS
jgi:hypothetical protein